MEFCASQKDDVPTPDITFPPACSQLQRMSRANVVDESDSRFSEDTSDAEGVESGHCGAQRRRDTRRDASFRKGMRPAEDAPTAWIQRDECVCSRMQWPEFIVQLVIAGFVMLGRDN